MPYRPAFRGPSGGVHSAQAVSAGLANSRSHPPKGGNSEGGHTGGGKESEEKG